LIDLGGWLDERYRIHEEKPDDEPPRPEEPHRVDDDVS
jgi:endogenous inhibitor of DNA gyrase (YacG/DUF329 family)